MRRTGSPEGAALGRGAELGSGDAGTMDPDVEVARTDEAHPGCGGAGGGSGVASAFSLARAGSLAVCISDEPSASVVRTHSVNCLNICLFTLSIIPRPNCAI